MRSHITSGLIGLLLSIGGCSSESNSEASTLQNSEYLHRAMKGLTNQIVYDIFSPPVASRIYAYASIGAYEAMVPSNSEYQSLAGQLNGLSPVPQPSTEYSPEVASLHAFFLIGQPLVHSGSTLASYRDALYEDIREETGISKALFQASLDYGKQVATHMQGWMATDGYAETRTYPKYTIQSETRYWKPTPPDYMEGIEPSWNKIRPFVLDSARQFLPKPPVPFSMEAGSEFYRQLMEVYTTGVNLSEEQTNIAKFWDCNPYVSQHFGHAMYAVKKITPGGHWIGITTIATRKVEADFAETAETYARVSIALADAFISCWDEKWRSLLVRPETLIAESIDRDWRPLLQTPPFPEYTSGHSVISTAAAVTLTHLYGDDFGFRDTTEMEYGLPARSFDSFLDASQEAAISRLYGGIHYRMAIDEGVAQGKQVGKYVVKQLQTRVPREQVTMKED